MLPFAGPILEKSLVCSENGMEKAGYDTKSNTSQSFAYRNHEFVTTGNCRRIGQVSSSAHSIFVHSVMIELVVLQLITFSLYL